MKRSVAERFDAAVAAPPSPMNGVADRKVPPRLRSVCMADVDAERVEWLWPGRVPLGKLTVIGGCQGLGKSMLVMDMAARISTGTSWADCQDEQNPVGTVVLLCAEDGLGDTIRPRLDAAGADCRRIVAVEAVEEIDGSGGRAFNLRQDVRLLEEEIERLGDVRMVVIDPLSSYIPGDVNSHRDNDVRSVLTPLIELAARHEVAVVAVMHLSKAGTERAVYRVLGSVAFTAAPRAAWMVTDDPDDPEARLMVCAKFNLGRAAKSARFAIDDPGCVRWDAELSDITCDQAFAPRVPDVGDEMSPKVQEAVDWLHSQLVSGPQFSKELKKRANAEGLSWRSIERAKGPAGVSCGPSAGPGSPWHYYIGQCPPDLTPNTHETADSGGHTDSARLRQSPPPPECLADLLEEVGDDGG